METIDRKILVIDFETNDPHMELHGAGWVFKIHYPEYEFEVLGAAYITHDGKEGYINDWALLQKILDDHDALVMHNTTYDVGCLLCLHSEGKIVFDLKKHYKYDTIILAKLWTQNFMRYGLDHLSKALLKNTKKSDILHEFAWSTGLYQDVRKKLTGINTKKKPSDAVLENFCKKNMKLFPDEIVAEYAIGDVAATKELFHLLMKKLAEPIELGLDLELYSDLQNIVVDSRCRGVRIDLNRLHEIQKEFEDKRQLASDKLFSHSRVPIALNINSPKQLCAVLIDRGHTLPLTEKGNPSSAGEVLETLDDDFVRDLIRLRAVTKIKRDFVDKIVDYQDILPDYAKEGGTGMVFPTMKILGATSTGRFSSSGKEEGATGKCLEVNIQQIPSRNKEFGEPCRSFFIAQDGEEWGYGDFSGQECRIQVHYAKLLNCDGVDSIIADWIADPSMSFHLMVAILTGLDKDQSKCLNLGLAYGMGEVKMYRALGTTDAVGKQILLQYHRMMPFLKQLQKKCSSSLLSNGYVRTLGNRRLVIGKHTGAERDGLNKLVQGSAADQTKRSMQRAWKAGLRIIYSVHDEINISTNNPWRDVPILKECMEGAYKLVVPVLAETGSGGSWLAAKKNAG